jgi:DNA-binding CsgD family transcriptional regulator
MLSLQLTGARAPELVEAVLAGTSLRGADVWEELAFRFLAARWRLVTGAGVEAATDALMRDVGPGFACRAALDALALGIRIETDGRSDDALPPLRAASPGGGIDGFVARLVLAFAMIVGGQGEEALVQLDVAPPPGTPRAVTVQQDYARGLALYAAGQLEEAEAWASAHLEACLADIDRDGLVGHAYVAVMARAALGRFEEAFETAQLVLATGVEAGQLPFAPDRAILTVLAFVAIRTGRATAAHALAERASALPGHSDGIPFGTPALVVAARRSADGFGEEAADEYRELAVELRARGYVLAAETLEMIALLAHYDPAASRPPQGDAGGAAGGELFRAWLAGEQAQRDDDPDALVDASRVLRRFGARDQALKLLGHAARLYRLRGEEAAGERTQEELRELLDDSLHAAGGAIEEFGLTDREAEIVQGIAEGLSNVEIAARLGVSIRTIDSHLRNIRQKTGTVEREDLARIAGRVTS